MKRAEQGMPLSQVMNINQMTHSAFFVFFQPRSQGFSRTHKTLGTRLVFCCSKRWGTIKCYVFFSENLLFCSIFRPFFSAWTNNKGLNLVNDEELFIETVNGTGNVGFD